MKINILIDNLNNWTYTWAPKLLTKIEQLGHQCQLLTKHQDIPSGWDVTLFLGCENYISQKTRAKNLYNIVVHASDLPQGKGMSPATWQILEGKNEIPMTLFAVADKIDEGDYYLKDSYSLTGSELLAEWQEKQYQCLEKMIIEFLKNINQLKPTKQQGQSSYYQRRTPKDSELDINKSIKEQFNLLRVVDNERYPAFFIYKNHKYILKIYQEKNNESK